jgi:hypothetical protein
VLDAIVHPVARLGDDGLPVPDSTVYRFRVVLRRGFCRDSWDYCGFVRCTIVALRAVGCGCPINFLCLVRVSPGFSSRIGLRSNSQPERSKVKVLLPE